MAPPDDGQEGRETPGVATWKVLLPTVGFLLFVAASLWGLQAYYGPPLEGFGAPRPREFPAPRLQTAPKADLARLQAEQRRRLEGYAWADRGAGLVHVPIERAMALVAAKGADAYAPVQPAPGPFRPGDQAQGSAPP